jgi:hypothetical protein
MNREERIDALLDKAEILELLNRYSRGIDRHDVDLIHDFFDLDGVDNHGAFEGNREEFAEWSNSVHEQTTVAHSHLVGSPTIVVSGDEARSEMYVYAVLKLNAGDTVDIVGGRYLDKLQRRDGQWKVMRRTFLVDWSFEADSKDRRKMMTRYPIGKWDESDPSYAHFAELHTSLVRS